jgi:hypothetical protein
LNRHGKLASFRNFLSSACRPRRTPAPPSEGDVAYHVAGKFSTGARRGQRPRAMRTVLMGTSASRPPPGWERRPTCRPVIRRRRLHVVAGITCRWKVEIERNSRLHAPPEG